MSEIELSVVLPCLNEAETVATCVRKAVRNLSELGINGEVIVADNGSTDGSQDLACAEGARVVHVSTRRYGAAIRGGIQAARGKYVLMADSDDSYDLGDLGPFVESLRAGNELVMGNRFAGGIEPGAMSFLHRVGNPVLSGIGKLFFNIPIGDFHCGIRAFDRHRILELDLHTTGMEFASEVVVQSSLARLRIAEVPTTLRKDGRSRPPHLRTWRDGWRHLRFLLMYSPGWLFLLPGYAMIVAGLLGGYTTIRGPRAWGSVVFDTGTLVVSALLLLMGTQLVLFWLAARSFASSLGLLPRSTSMERSLRRMTLERGVALGIVACLAGASGVTAALIRWRNSGFGELDPSTHLRLLVPSATAVVFGMQLMFGSFLLGISRLRVSDPTPQFVETEASAVA
jgi:glycosyltransferase involved in cell wall biosynthesis